MRRIPAWIFVSIAIAMLITARDVQAGLLKEGDIAPNFSTDAILGDQSNPVHLTDYRGRIVVLYFYPKDFTTGCTTEACSFRDGYSKLQRAGIVLLGCSVDSADAHRAFIKKYSLPFPLLIDPEKKIATAYGTANGIAKLGLDGRVTYVIGGDGRILKVYPKVDPANNAAEIIRDFGEGKPHTAAN
jgi:peroxiredoxin Q/BCP